MKNDRLYKLRMLFQTFMKIGMFTFGGGYAMIPLIQKEVVEQKKWLTNEDILEVVAIAESTPGPIAINAATFVGYRVCGFWGACFATTGIVLPSFFLILLISFFLKEFQHFPAVQYAFQGIRAGVLALMLRAVYMMYKQSPKNIASCIIMASAFLLTAFLHVDVLIVIIGCAVFGLIVSLLLARRVK